MTESGSRQERAAEAGAESTEVVALLTEQRDLCRHLASLAERQGGLITGDQPELLLGVLAERQKLLDRLGEVGARLRPFQQRWREVRLGMSSAQGPVVDQMVSDVNSLLAAILQKDEADAHLLAVRKQTTGQRMTELKQSKVAGAAYASAGSMTASREWSAE